MHSISFFNKKKNIGNHNSQATDLSPGLSVLSKDVSTSEDVGHFTLHGISVSSFPQTSSLPKGTVFRPLETPDS